MNNCIGFEQSNFQVLPIKNLSGEDLRQMLLHRYLIPKEMNAEGGSHERSASSDFDNPPVIVVYLKSADIRTVRKLNFACREPSSNRLVLNEDRLIINLADNAVEDRIQTSENTPDPADFAGNLEILKCLNKQCGRLIDVWSLMKAAMQEEIDQMQRKHSHMCRLEEFVRACEYPLITDERASFPTDVKEMESRLKAIPNLKDYPVLGNPVFVDQICEVDVSDKEKNEAVTMISKMRKRFRFLRENWEGEANKMADFCSLIEQKFNDLCAPRTQSSKSEESDKKLQTSSSLTEQKDRLPYSSMMDPQAEILLGDMQEQWMKFANGEHVDVEMLLKEAITHRQAIQAQQMRARFQFLPCFHYWPEKKRSSTDPTEKDFISLPNKFQLLADYFEKKQLPHRFADVVKESIIQEWVCGIEQLSDNICELTDKEGRKIVYWDRAPFYVLFRQSQSAENPLPTYRIRVLALKGDFSNIMEGSATTKLQSRSNSENFVNAEHIDIVEMSGLAKNKKKAEENKDNKTAQKVYAEAPRKYDSLFSSSFQISAENEKVLLPKDRNINDFRLTDPENGIKFDISNIMLDKNNKFQNGQNPNQYRLLTTLEFKCSFRGTLITIQIPEEEAIVSAAFQATSSRNFGWKPTFTFIWSSLLECYGNNQGDESLPWKHVYTFIQHYLSTLFFVNVRPLTQSEMRNVQHIIKLRRLALLTNVIRHEDVITVLCLNELHNNEPIADDEPITVDDFMRNCANFIANLTTDGIYDLQMLNFSLYRWLHGAYEVLANVHLHSKFQTTVKLFNRQILSMQPSIAAMKIMERCREKQTSSEDNMLIMRFDDRTPAKLVFDFMDYKKGYCFGTITAKDIGSEIFHVVNHNSTDAVKAGLFGCFKKKEGTATGLYAFFKAPYPSKFSLIFTGEETIGKQEAQPNFIRIFGKDADCVYNFDLIKRRTETFEVNAQFGPTSEEATDIQNSVAKMRLLECPNKMYKIFRKRF